MSALYDQIGRTYGGYRTPDPRIEAIVSRNIGEVERIVNIGAGTGSYEPANRAVIAVEPSLTMISQRTSGGPPIVQAEAEALPFADGMFDLALALLTIHHWSDWEKGLEEMLRVANGNLIILTWIGFPKSFWLTDYFPEIEEVDLANFPSVEGLRRILGPIRLEMVPIASDCKDGFLCAYWKRPTAYLETGVRNNISTFAKIKNVEEGLRALACDLKTGEWNRKYESVLYENHQDFGYRIVTCDRTAV